MEEERYKRKRHHWKILVFLVFAAILLGLWYTSTHPGFSINGNIIGAKQANSTIKFDASLSVPTLNLDGNFGEIYFNGNSDSFLYVEGEKIKLGSMSNYISLENYNGKISFDGGKISALKGTASRVLVNGLPVESKSSSNVQVSLDRDFKYTLLNIENTSKIKEISYAASGNIRINDGKNTFDVNGNKIVASNFLGNMQIENGKFRPSGYVSRLDIMGDANISVS